MIPEIIATRNGILRPSGQSPLLKKIRQRVVGKIGEQHLSHRAAVSRIPGTDARRHFQSACRLLRLNFVHIDHLIPIQNHQMRRLFRLLREIPQNRFRNLPKIKLAAQLGIQIHQLQAQKVELRRRVLADIPKIGQGGEDAVYRPFREIQSRGQISDAHPLGILSHPIENQGNPLDRLDEIARLGLDCFRFHRLLSCWIGNALP